MEPQAKKCKIRGWLLLFCLSLVIFSPLRSIYELTIIFIEISPYFQHVPGLLNLFISNIIANAFLIIFAVRSGLMLWQCNPFAVSAAKNYMKMLIMMNIASLFFPFLFIDYELANEMLPEIIADMLDPIIFVAIWYPFLNMSKQVKQTFSQL
jgi:hypothetical protein